MTNIECPRMFFFYFTYLAELKRPWKFDHKVKMPFSINQVIDTNLPMYLNGPGGEAHKDVGCLCCSDGHLDFNSM